MGTLPKAEPPLFRSPQPDSGAPGSYARNQPLCQESAESVQTSQQLLPGMGNLQQGDSRSEEKLWQVSTRRKMRGNDDVSFCLANLPFLAHRGAHLQDMHTWERPGITSIWTSERVSRLRKNSPRLPVVQLATTSAKSGSQLPLGLSLSPALILWESSDRQGIINEARK